jgi:hypothetical protein
LLIDDFAERGGGELRQSRLANQGQQSAINNQKSAIG